MQRPRSCLRQQGTNLLNYITSLFGARRAETCAGAEPRSLCCQASRNESTRRDLEDWKRAAGGAENSSWGERGAAGSHEGNLGTRAGRRVSQGPAEAA